MTTTADSSMNKRTRLVEAAARLTHEHGFHRTSLADVADASGVPVGNVFYYFKTKDALGEALVDRLADAYGCLRADWDSKTDPRLRLEAFVAMSVDNRDALSRSGCPIGTLCAELHKDGGPVADRAASLLATLLAWIEAQFREMGKGEDSPALAVQLLAAIQGATLLTHSFHDTRYVTQEAARLVAWLRNV